MEQKIECFNEDTIELLQSDKLKSLFVSKENNLCYLDLPYGGESSDYLKLYSFLEEYIELKNVNDLTKLKKANERFSNKNNYEQNFRLLLNLLFDLNLFQIWVLSFNESSFSHLENIKNILRLYADKIIIKQTDYKYQYRKDKSNNKGTEYLIICYIKERDKVQEEKLKIQRWLDE